MAIDIEARDIALAARGSARLGAPVPVVGIIGDSITAPDFNGSPGGAMPANVLKAANGIMAWALALSDQRVVCPAASNVWSFPGQETGTILSNLSAFLAQMPSRPGAVIVECGTNNIYHDAVGSGTGGFSAITGDWQAIARLLGARGIRTLFIPILPRTNGFTPLFTAAQFDMMSRCNRWLVDFAQRSGGVVAVASTCLPWVTDPASIGAQPKANYMTDGTHPGVTGAYYVGKAVAHILNNWYPPLDLLPACNMSWAATAPQSNLIGNAMMQGSGGSVAAPSAGTIAGTAPTGWVGEMSNSAGLTVTHSQVTSAMSGLPMHQMILSGAHTVTGSSAGPTYGHYGRIRQAVSGTAVVSLNAGDTLEALIAFEIDAGAQGLAFPTLEMRWGGSAGYNRDMHSAPRELPNEAIRGVLRTPPKTLTGTPASGDVMLMAIATLKSYPDGSVSDNATVRFGRAVLQKIAG